LAPKSGTLRDAFTSLVSVTRGYAPLSSGRIEVAVTLRVTRWMSASCAAGTGPFAQSHGVDEPRRYTVNSGYVPVAGRAISATRSLEPPLSCAMLPVLSPYT